MKKTTLRPKKEKKLQNKEIKEGYLDSDLDDPDNKKLYENVKKRIQNNELDIYKNKNLEQGNRFLNKNKERNNRYKELDKTKDEKKKLRKKTVDRGGKYNNIQATYIIYSKRDIKFHIIEPSTESFNKPLLYDKNRTNRKEPKGNVKVTYRSSCDNFKIKNKKKQKEKTVIYYHCAELKQKDLEKYKNKKQKKLNNNTNNNIKTIVVPKEDKKEEDKKAVIQIDNKIIKTELENELNEDDIVKIVKAILSQITLNDIKNPKKIYINEIDNYLLKKEEDKKLKEIVQIINEMKEKEKEEIIYILTCILEDNNEFIKKLKKEIGIKNESLEKLFEGYKSSIKELEHDKLEILTEQIITDIMKEYPLNENEKRMDMINKAANIIINLNKDDQEKILNTLNDINKNEYQKENIDKLRDLVENLNNIRIYLYNISKNNLFKENKKELSSTELDKVKSQIFNEKDLNNNNDIDKIALRLSALSKQAQSNILNEINKKASESNNISRQSINKLNRVLKSIKLIKILRSTIKKRNSSKKKIFDDNKIKEFTFNIYDKLTENKKPTNWTEKLLINQKEERKKKNLAQSLICFNDENLQKTTIFSNDNKIKINDKNKSDIEKLKTSLMTKNDNIFNKTMLQSQMFMIKSLGIIELNDTELNILKEAFSKDLFTDKIMDINKKEENLNLIANLIKELDEENQTKLLEKLENEQSDQNKINLIKDLKDRVLKLNLLKDELREENEEKNINNIDNDDDLIEDFDLDELNETMTVELSTDEIEEDDIKDICQVFNVDYKDNEKEENNKEKDNKNINSIFENSLLRLDNNSQKKLTEKLEEKAKNKEEKEQLEGLMENLKKLNNYKKIGNEIKSKREEEKKEFENELEKIIKLNNNCIKNLDLEIIDKLIKEIINNLFENIIIDFCKNKIIENYIIKSKKEENLWKSAAKIVHLSNEDEKHVLNEIKTFDENNKKDIYNNLFKSIEILKMIKNIKKNVELKKNDLIVPKISNLSPEEIKEKLESLLQMLNKEKVEKKDIINVVDELNKLDNINQELIFNNLKEKISNNNKESIIKQIETLLNKKKIQKSFAYKVLERYLKKIILEKERNEKKYGICLDDNDKNRAMILKKPNELNETKFNEVKNNIMEDLTNISKEKEKEDNDNSYSIEKEKKLEEIADVINSLDIDDKTKILEEIKNTFYKKNENNLYNEFIKILEKREKIFNKEKIERKNETIKEMEDKKKNDENNLLYSYIDLKNNNSSEIVIHDDEQTNNKNEEISDKSFTVNIGYLETEETY